MTEQPIEPRERGEEQNPETVSPQPDVSDPPSEPDEGSERYADALSGSGVGSDTRAGSLQGGAATGSEVDPDQDRIDETLKTEGMSAGEPRTFAAPEGEAHASQEAVNNVGQPNLGPHGDPVEGKRDDAATGGDDVDAASG